MKKILHYCSSLGLAALLATSSFAQINGDIYNAPNFNGYDINGVQYDFYADYLDQGIPIILDVSAHWCGPCWSYHNNHVLRDLYNEYGPAGTVAANTVMVIWADGDATSTMAELNGNGGDTQGNWVTGTPYPIFGGETGPGAGHGRDIADLYQISYFPTIFMIHPDRTVEEIGQISTVSGIITRVNGANPLSSATNDVKIKYSSNLIIEGCASDISNGKVYVQNYGTATLTSADIDVEIPGVYHDTIAWTGNLAQYDVSTFNLPAITNIPDGNHTININLINPNGVTDEDLTNGQFTSTFEAKSTGRELEIGLDLDNYPDETSWEIRNSSGAVVMSGADYSGDATELFCSDSACYTFYLYDSYGDGLLSGGVTVFYNGRQLVNIAGNSFTSSTNVAFCTYDANAPALMRNNGATVPIMESVTINSAKLDASDAWSTDNDIVYNVVTAPAYGQLELTTNPGVVITSFTQADVNFSKLKYVHTANSNEADQFQFNLSENGTSNVSTLNAFAITVTGEPDAAPTAKELSVKVFPNPLKNTAFVNVENLNAEAMTVKVTNILGEVVFTEDFGAVSGTKSVSINTENFQAGVYLVEVKAGENSVLRKVVK